MWPGWVGRTLKVIVLSLAGLLALGVPVEHAVYAVLLPKEQLNACACPPESTLAPPTRAVAARAKIGRAHV